MLCLLFTFIALCKCYWKVSGNCIIIKIATIYSAPTIWHEPCWVTALFSHLFLKTIILASIFIPISKMAIMLRTMSVINLRFHSYLVKELKFKVRLLISQKLFSWDIWFFQMLIFFTSVSLSQAQLKRKVNVCTVSPSLIIVTRILPPYFCITLFISYNSEILWEVNKEF